MDLIAYACPTDFSALANNFNAVFVCQDMVLTLNWVDQFIFFAIGIGLLAHRLLGSLHNPVLRHDSKPKSHTDSTY